MAKQITSIRMDSDVRGYLRDLGQGNCYYNNSNLITTEVILKIGSVLTGFPDSEVYNETGCLVGVPYGAFKQMLIRKKVDLGSKRFQVMAERPKFKTVYDCLMDTRDFYSIYGSVHGLLIKNNARSSSSREHDILRGMTLSVGAAILGISAVDIIDMIHRKYAGLIH